MKREEELTVSVKPLEWEDIGSGFSRAPAPLFGNIRVEKYGEHFTTCYSVPGYCNSFAVGLFDTPDEAKAACEEEYQERIRSAILSTPNPEAEPIAHLVWLQGRRAADDVEDYYEVARPGDKSVDGSDPFPVYAHPMRQVKREEELTKNLWIATLAIRTYMPGILPADENGQAHFARELAEAAAEAIEEFLLSTGAHEKATADVIAERRRQIEVEGFNANHDDGYTQGVLAQAGVAYALSAIGNTSSARGWWPSSWRRDWFKPTTTRRDLVKAATLIIAEIERIDRSALTAKEGGE